MKKFTVVYMVTGGVEIFADSEEEAIRKFNDIPDKDLFDELEPNGINYTEVYEEDEFADYGVDEYTCPHCGGEFLECECRDEE